MKGNPRAVGVQNYLEVSFYLSATVMIGSRREQQPAAPTPARTHSLCCPMGCGWLPVPAGGCRAAEFSRTGQVYDLQPH